MRAAFGLGDDFIDDAEIAEVLGRDAQRLRGELGLAGIAPQDRGAALRRNHRIDRILEHVHLIAHGDGQRAAGAAFAGDGDDDGHGQARHGAQIDGDGFGLAALLGVEAGIGAGRIDKREDRPAELGGELHQPQRLAIALGLGLAEVARHALLGVAALLVAEDQHVAAFELARSRPTMAGSSPKARSPCSSEKSVKSRRTKSSV